MPERGIAMALKMMFSEAVDEGRARKNNFLLLGL
jgi:hypothetical protein